MYTGTFPVSLFALLVPLLGARLQQNHQVIASSLSLYR